MIIVGELARTKSPILPGSDLRNREDDEDANFVFSALVDPNLSIFGPYVDTSR